MTAHDREPPATTPPQPPVAATDGSGTHGRRRGARRRTSGRLPPAGHGHGHGPVAPASKRLRTVVAAVLVPFAVAVAAGLLALWPGGSPTHQSGPSGVGFDQHTESGKVRQVVAVDCADKRDDARQPSRSEPGDDDVMPPDSGGGAPGDGGDTAGNGDTAGDGDAAGGGGDGRCERTTIEVTSGKDRGRRFTELVQPSAARHYTVGQRLVLSYAPKAPKNLQYSVSDVKRTMPVALLAGAFALVVVAVGRLRGLLALVALVVSFGVLTLFILPAILHGSNPLLVAVVGGGAIMLIALYMCHGLTARTSVAVLGTLVSLVLIGALGSLFIGWARLTGNTDDQTGLVHGLYPDIEIRGLLLASIIIGSLGVLDDVTVTQTSAVWELREANPAASWRSLYASAMRIGRDHIASVVNTLVLAYAGAALPLLLLFTIADSGVATVATSEIVAEEIVRTLVGSIGLVASVPLTTALAALVVSSDGGRTAAGARPSGLLPWRSGRVARPGAGRDRRRRH